VPAEAFLDACPLKDEATILAVLEAVRQAPPPQFSGRQVGGHARDDGRLQRDPRDWSRPAQELAARGFQEPQIAVITGMRKPFRTGRSESRWSR
jgi:hypothetical protein